MDEIEGLARGSRCVRKKKGKDGVMRCAKFSKGGSRKKATKSRRGKTTTRRRRPSNKGKVCIRFKSVDGVKRCAKFGSKSAKKKTAKRTTKRKTTRKSSAKKPSKRRRATGGGSNIEVSRHMALTFGGKLRKGCRPKPGAKGKALCSKAAVAKMSTGGSNVRSSGSAARGRSVMNSRGGNSRFGRI